jgi:hypothetical protein
MMPRAAAIRLLLRKSKERLGVTHGILDAPPNGLALEAVIRFTPRGEGTARTGSHLTRTNT